MIRSKRDLEIQLSRLKTFSNPSWKLEQYTTSSSVAADWVWHMTLNGDVIGKTILDAACGNGILGLGLLLMRAKKVFFLDKDQEVINLAISNYNQLNEEYELGEAKFIHQDISLFDGKIDIVIQNPPFGTKNEHADKKFLEKAFSLAPIVYSMHKTSTRKFVEAVSKDFNFRVSKYWHYEFPIKAAFSFHTKPIKKIEVTVWRLEKTFVISK